MYRKSNGQVSKLGIGVISKCNVTCGRFGFRFRLFDFCSAFDSAFGSKSVFVEALDIDKVWVSVKRGPDGCGWRMGKCGWKNADDKIIKTK